ncbi:hypothetical protein [Brevundimonas sp.]|uniref:hypothetical protein n=1 Tax=Brevundimonas sp. TaxID=1871086 RepID=UPI0028963AF7|nr:hypothetical protein [Brevundimonas sp.]
MSISFLPLIPANAGTQSFRMTGLGHAASIIGEIHRPKNWVPAFAGMSGEIK